MRQLTNNQIRLSEERGWELLWLATGIMTCSSNLHKEILLFLTTRTSLLAADCLNRLDRAMKMGNRKYPPYILEVEAIRFKSLHIYHKIYFPDDSNEAFEVISKYNNSKSLKPSTKLVLYDLLLFNENRFTRQRGQLIFVKI